MFLASCAPDVRLFSCADDGVAEALADACERYDVACDVATRLDIRCADDITTFSKCGRSRATDVETCTEQLGTTPVPGTRAEMHVRSDVSVGAAIAHEAQHWHLWADYETNACESHEAACGWIED